ncbi:hypothetical protein ACFSL4_36805 [Streptomyces caeni]|uniref:Uncharacterized protein n=1 Tax=Streptomyces caeni TaxID=2307231 RepID=A0ABW4J1V7_9ACTN
MGDGGICLCESPESGRTTWSEWKVTGPVWLPLYDVDFWALPHLDGKGLKAEDLLPVLRTSPEVMRERDRVTPDTVRIQSLDDELHKAVAALDMTPSRFEFAPSDPRLPPV